MYTEYLQGAKLGAIEIQILKCLKKKAQTEKGLADRLEVAYVVLYPLITDLILKGYVETFRRRRSLFFSREYITITVEGLTALQGAKNMFQVLVESMGARAFELADRIALESPIIKVTFVIAKSLYNIAKIFFR